MPAGSIAQAHISSSQIDATGGGKFRSLKHPTATPNWFGRRSRVQPTV